MINLEDLKLTFGEYESIKVSQQGSVAKGNIVALGFNVGFEIEGSLIGIKAAKDDIIIEHIYKSDDKVKCLNEFFDFIRRDSYLNNG